MQRYKSLNDEHAKAREAEDRRQQEERAQLEAARSQRGQEQRQEAERKGYEVLRDAAQKLLDEERVRAETKNRELEKAAREDQTKRQMDVQVQDTTRAVFGAASAEARELAQFKGPKQQSAPHGGATTGRSDIEFTPDGQRFRQNIQRPQGRGDAEDTKAQERSEQQAQSFGKEMTERRLAEQAKDNAKEKTGADIAKAARALLKETRSDDRGDRDGGRER